MISYSYSPDLRCIVAFDGRRAGRIILKVARQALRDLRDQAGEYAAAARVQLSEALRLHG